MVKDTPLSLAQDHFFWTWYWYFHVNKTLTSPYFTFSLKYVSFWRRFNFPPGKGFPLLLQKYDVFSKFRSSLVKVCWKIYTQTTKCSVWRHDNKSVFPLRPSIKRKKERKNRRKKKKKKQTFSALLILHRLFEFLTLKSLLMFALWKQTNRQ